MIEMRFTTCCVVWPKTPNNLKMPKKVSKLSAGGGHQTADKSPI